MGTAAPRINATARLVQRALPVRKASSTMSTAATMAYDPMSG